MERFLERHADHVLGVLCGFDRLLFRGTLRRLSYVSGLECFLSRHKVLFKDFGAWAERMSQRLKEHAHRIAKERGGPSAMWPLPRAAKRNLLRRSCSATRSRRDWCAC